MGWCVVVVVVVVCVGCFGVGASGWIADRSPRIARDIQCVVAEPLPSNRQTRMLSLCCNSGTDEEEDTHQLIGPLWK